MGGSTSRRRQNSDVAKADRPAVVDTIANRPSLTPDQADLIREVTRSGDGVQIIGAAAGTGKTCALAAARDAWEERGLPVEDRRPLRPRGVGPRHIQPRDALSGASGPTMPPLGGLQCAAWRGRSLRGPDRGDVYAAGVVDS